MRGWKEWVGFTKEGKVKEESGSQGSIYTYWTTWYLSSILFIRAVQYISRVYSAKTEPQQVPFICYFKCVPFLYSLFSHTINTPHPSFYQFLSTSVQYLRPFPSSRLFYLFSLLPSLPQGRHPHFTFPLHHIPHFPYSWPEYWKESRSRN